MSTTELVIRDCPSQVDTGYSRLLSLPKELRLEIWRYAITDPSVDRPIIRIDREYLPSSLTETPHKRSCDSLRQHTRFYSLAKATFENSRSRCLGVQLLRSNRLMYHEALPLLYHSVTFFPCQTSMFPEFLSSLSNFAKQHISYVRLCIDDYIQPRHHVDWALLCAQTASLPCLRQVEVLSTCMHRSQPAVYGKRLLGPLLKIRVPKKMLPEGDNDFQKTLTETKEELKVEKAARKERAELEAAKQELWPQVIAEEDPVFSEKNKTRRFDSFSIADEPTTVSQQYTEEISDGYKTGAEDWDMASLHSIEPKTSDSVPEPVPDTKRARSELHDKGSSSSEDDDWELID